MKWYFVSGLGYDRRIFERLRLEMASVEYIEWIEPKGEESIRSYARRLFQNIPDGGEDVVLIGYSLGGLMVQEIAAERSFFKIVLLSSIRAAQEMHVPFRLIKSLQLYRFITAKGGIRTIRYWGHLQGYSNATERDLFKQMMRDRSDAYLQWAFKTIVQWTAPTLPAFTKIVRIHGTADRIFLFRNISPPDIVIPEGTHLMVYRRPEEIAQALKKAVSLLNTTITS
jgi:pimeloyl-ACP methyl ester carboxylesterase